MSRARAKKGLAGLVAPEEPLDELGSGFGFLEGPVWDTGSGSLLFSDVPGEVRYRWSAARGIEIDLQGPNKANGLAIDGQGRLLSCEHATSMVVLYADGHRGVLASRYEGLGLNSPNDLVIHSSGAVYFTDPPYGRSDTSHGVARDQELGFQGVFRLDPDVGDESLQLLSDDFAKPNGLCFDHEEAVLYVNDTERMHIRRFSLRIDGSLEGGEVFFVQDGDPDTGCPDGMKLDEQGNIWVYGPGGIWVVNPDGARLGVVPVPELAANLAWGEHDRRSLFITASTGLYRIRTLVAGATPRSSRQPA